jgi:dTDP-4-amino-4,6-dideoxygalactose transaminase
MTKIFAQNISVNVHFQPLPLLTAYKNMGYLMADYPQAYANYCNEISLPVYYSLSDEDVQRITETLIEAVQTTL